MEDQEELLKPKLKYTYANYHKAYYYKNKKKIVKRTREYNKFKCKRYYYQHKQEINRKKAEERLKARSQITLLDQILKVDLDHYSKSVKP